jgi:hypothetical protein
MGSIAINVAAVAGTPAIDTEGTDDWLAHVLQPSGTALRGLNPPPASKRLGGGELLLNFDWLVMGAAPTAFTQNPGFSRTAAAADNVTGAAFNSSTASGYWHASALNYGFRLRARADTGTRTLHVYLGHWSSTVTITARLLDGSAANGSTTSVSGASTQANRKVSITFTADSVTDLVVTFVLTAGTNNPNILFSAATLATSVPGEAGGGGDPPTISIVSPTPGVAAGDPGGFPADFDEAIRTPIVIEIDAPDGVALACVVVRFKDEIDKERVVYRRGAFRRGFAAQSFAEIDGDVLRLHCIPDTVWPASSANVLDDISFDVDSVGGDGSALSAIGASS